MHEAPTMHEAPAIQFSGVSKVYQLYGSQVDQLISVLRLHRFGLRPRAKPSQFVALNDIDLTVPRGHRLGVIGRNGAGKTTLLKLVCGNIAPTSGQVVVNGTVQALMTSGTGFHPDHTGRENIVGALQYNGLRRDEYKEATCEIIEFCELGEFIDQPFKTYSLGMQARLMFATATAIRPDILIVDEVLGAGDAYFVAKSRLRIEKLIESGCTMLLVSHSMQQVMELCDEAIWIDCGSVRMQGSAFDVVKAYEEYIHGPISKLESGLGIATSTERVGDDGISPAKQIGTLALTRSLSDASAGSYPNRLLQDPPFCPHALPPMNTGNAAALARDFSAVAPGGLSRWKSEIGLKVRGFEIISSAPTPNTLVCLQPAVIAMRLMAEASGHFRCRYGIAIHDLLGRCMTRIFSPMDEFDIQERDERIVQIQLNPNQIGPGDYSIGVSVLHHGALETLNSTARYDLLSRSFAIKVELPDSLAGLESQFFHSAEWAFAPVSGGQYVEE